MTGLYTHERAELKRVKKMNAAARQRAYKSKMSEAGFVQVHGWVRPDQMADIVILLENLRADPDLMVGPARNTRTGRLHKLR